MAQHVWCDVGRQIAQLGDPQPHIPIANDRRLAGRLANTTSLILGWALITVPAGSDKGRSDAPVLVSASRAVRRARSTSDHRRSAPRHDAILS